MSRTQTQSSSIAAGWIQSASQAAAVGTALLLTVPAEIARLRLASQTKLGWLAWIFEINLDTTLPLALLYLVPAFWLIRRRPDGPPAADRQACDTDGGKHRFDRLAWTLAACCGLTSLAASAWVAAQTVGQERPVRFGDLPPAYHDEFSYRFQARTFLAGRTSYPSHALMPALFDQMHVVNEGRFASRYFPGAGAWIAPFLAIGHPYWGQWLAGALAAFWTFAAGRELAGNGVGFLAGMLTALSPGLALFSNLLLAHQPTLAALSLFLFAFLRFMRTERAGDALCAGCGLALAMLCRPMTAAGVGLPFGLWFLYRLARGGRADQSSGFARRVRLALWLALPLAAGLVLLFSYNRAITGNGFVSPYQLYTDTYTPRHVYGFNNVVRGERKVGPKVIENYDRWAENLTPELAARNVARRAASSARWTLGIVPLAMALVVFLPWVVWRRDVRWGLVLAAVVGLHAVHVPYWFVGIMEWHYVFESAPLLLLIFAVTTRELAASWQMAGRLLMPAWWFLLIASALITNWLPFDPFWSSSRVELGVEEIAFARLRYSAFEELIDQAVTKRPALLLIEGDPADRSIDYVVNDPDLSGPVLRGRYRPGQTDLAKVRAAFPGRTLYLFRVKAKELQRLTP